MLVLLIIFMVAAPLATVSVEVKLPSAVLKPVTNPPKPVFISIQKTGKYFIGDYPVDINNVGAEVAKVLPLHAGVGMTANERIYIRADGEVMYMDFMHLVAALQDKGYYSVALVEADGATGQKK